MKFALLVVGVFAARFVTTAIFFPQSDGDLSWQRWLGGVILQTGKLPRSIGPEVFTAPGAPWVPQEWLFSIAAYLSQGAGWYALASGCALAATAALIVGAWRAHRAGVSRNAIAIAVALAGMALLESFGVRVQVVAWPFLALFLLCLEIDGPAMYSAIVVAAVWSNIHASVMIAPVLAFVLCAGNLLDEGNTSRSRRLLLIAVGCIGATCLNPLGWAIPRYALMLFSSPFTTMIAEWQRTDLDNQSFARGSLPLLLILATFGIHGPRRWSQRLLVLTTALLMFGARRNISIFAIACFPAVAQSLAPSLAFMSRPDRRLTTGGARTAAVLTGAFTAVVAVIVGAALLTRSRSVDIAKDDLSPALASIVSLPGSHNVLCRDFAWCSYLLAGGRERLFIDGRADPYPLSVWKDFESIVWLEPGWSKALDVRKTDVILVDVSSSLEQALELSPKWRSAYRNDTYRVWTLRAAPALTMTAARVQ